MREKFFEASDFQRCLASRWTLLWQQLSSFLYRHSYSQLLPLLPIYSRPHPNLKKSLKSLMTQKEAFEKESKDTIEAEERVNKAAEILGLRLLERDI